jgi:hypothetical protein
MASGTVEIKRHIIRGANVKTEAVVLYVNDYQGEMWACNRYWAVRASRVAPLLEEYNLSVGEPGAYDVNGKVKRANGDNNGNPVVPKMTNVLHSLSHFDVPGTRVKVGGQDVYFLSERSGVPMAVYQLATGQVVGLIADELDWLSRYTDAPIPEGCHVSGIRLMFHVNAEGKAQAAVIGDVTHTVERAKYGQEATDYAAANGIEISMSHIPAVTEPGEPVLLASVMTTKYGG